ncbi:hypothetical protein T492DRAFT_907014, partial [Pavlovales sp. CCMP2436]
MWLYTIQLSIWVITCFSHHFLEARHKDYALMCALGPSYYIYYYYYSLNLGDYLFQPPLPGGTPQGLRPHVRAL